jgi:hypothetical protein
VDEWGLVEGEAVTPYLKALLDGMTYQDNVNPCYHQQSYHKEYINFEQTFKSGTQHCIRLLGCEGHAKTTVMN